ncbi:hypothetical protein T552_02188 [Pneumocystis carinii B80]|uniref:Uncharacterized protein n=1 Tax=Pneumocystis carinii (strain B80) TaxID=1408658 RepID=A0A0W4ZHA7_PNEC8|nr:hypothetical protein T552_02188 [Pneumocystis carinii B80]KTW27749.1 hypothetical protein T552_02188 [Pneumocystis carinii B80]
MNNSTRHLRCNGANSEEEYPLRFRVRILSTPFTDTTKVILVMVVKSGGTVRGEHHPAEHRPAWVCEYEETLRSEWSWKEGSYQPIFL